MSRNKTIEQKAGQTIRQQPTPITIGRKAYQVKPASVATIILVSEIVSTMPDKTIQDLTKLEWSLAFGRDCRPISEMAAALILGEKRYTRAQHPGLLHRILYRRDRELPQYISREYTPDQFTILMEQLVGSMEIDDFFGLTTSLIEINILRRTATTEVVKKTTASGR